MAKVTVTGLDKVRRQVGKNVNIQLNKVLREKELREGLAQDVIDYWRKNPFGTAAKATIDNRIYLEKYNKTHPSYATPLINVTFSGQQLDDLKRGTTASPTKGIIEIKNTARVRTRYSGANGKVGKSLKFDKLYSHLSGMGYDYLNLPKVVLDKLSKRIQDRLLRLFNLRR